MEGVKKEQQKGFEGEQHIIARILEIIKELDGLYAIHVGRRPNWEKQDFDRKSNINGNEIPVEAETRAKLLLDQLQTLRDSWKVNAPFGNFEVITNTKNDGLLVRDFDGQKKQYYLNDRLLPLDDYRGIVDGVVVGIKDGRVVFVSKDHEIHTKYKNTHKGSFYVNKEKHVAFFDGEKENGKYVGVLNGKEIGREYDFVQRCRVLPNGKVVFVGGDVGEVENRRRDTEFVVYDGVELPESFTRVKSDIGFNNGVLRIEDLESLYESNKQERVVSKLFAVVEGNPITFKRITLEEANRDYK